MCSISQQAFISSFKQSTNISAFEKVYSRIVFRNVSETHRSNANKKKRVDFRSITLDSTNKKNEGREEQCAGKMSHAAASTVIPCDEELEDGRCLKRDTKPELIHMGNTNTNAHPHLSQQAVLRILSLVSLPVCPIHVNIPSVHTEHLLKPMFRVQVV